MTIESLKNFGANTDEGLSRCFGMEDFYLKLVATVPDEGNFDRLAESIRANDLDAAFESAHALKGVLGNLSLTPIYDPVNEITDRLRSRTQADYSAQIDEILRQRELLRVLCAQ